MVSYVKLAVQYCGPGSGATLGAWVRAGVGARTRRCGWAHLLHYGAPGWVVEYGDVVGDYVIHRPNDALCYRDFIG